MTKKLKVYLDTNFIYDWFKRKAEEIKENRDFYETGKLAYLKENSSFIEAYSSFFTLIEVANRLREDFQLTKEAIIRLLALFEELYPVEILEEVRLDKETLKWFLEGIQWKDCIQLDISKNENCIFVTDDNSLIRKVRKSYRKITNFKGLQRKVNRIRFFGHLASSLLRSFPFFQK